MLAREEGALGPDCPCSMPSSMGLPRRGGEGDRLDRGATGDRRPGSPRVEDSLPWPDRSSRCRSLGCLGWLLAVVVVGADLAAAAAAAGVPDAEDAAEVPREPGVKRAKADPTNEASCGGAEREREREMIDPWVRVDEAQGQGAEEGEGAKQHVHWILLHHHPRPGWWVEAQEQAGGS